MSSTTPMTSLNRIRRESVVADSLADGILTGEILSCQGLINNDDKRLRCILRIAKEPPAQEFCLQGGEVAGTHIALIYLVVLSVIGPAHESDPRSCCR